MRTTADGTTVWSLRPEDRVRFRDDEYGPPWASETLSVYRAGGELRLAWALHHFTWWPSLLLAISPRGERLETFVNSGWIRAIAQSADDRLLLIAGVTNSQRGSFLAALDAEHPGGQSPEPPC